MVDYQLYLVSIVGSQHSSPSSQYSLNERMYCSFSTLILLVGSLTCHRLPDSLYCVGGDVNPCSINQSIERMHGFRPNFIVILRQLKMTVVRETIRAVLRLHFNITDASLFPGSYLASYCILPLHRIFGAVPVYVRVRCFNAVLSDLTARG